MANSDLFYAAGVDAGSQDTRTVVLGVRNRQVRLLGFGKAPSRGWVRGRIGDRNAVSQSIEESVRRAEAKAGITIESVVMGIGGSTIQGGYSRGVYEFGRKREVALNDLGYAVELASRVTLQEGRLLLQVFPQNFTVDGRTGSDPLGSICSRLEANVHILTASTQDHQCLVTAAQEAHLGVEETVFEPVAAAYAAVLPEERQRGMALVDIGLHSTDIAIYEGDALLLASSIPIGGDHFTRDVAYCLRTSYEDAQRLKEEYGCAILGLTSDSSLIEVPTAEDEPPRETTLRHLNEILEARAEELFTLVLEEVLSLGMEQPLLDGIVLAGGAAMLNGMVDQAVRTCNCQARVGLPVGIKGWADEIDDPSWTVAAGLAMYSARLKLRKEPRRRFPSLRGLLFE